METLYATFADPNQAHTATKQLAELGLAEDHVSLLVRENGHVRSIGGGVDLEDTRPTTPMQGESFTSYEDPTSNRLRNASVPRIERGVDAEVQIHARGGGPEEPSGFESEEDLEATPAMDPTGEGLRFSRGFNAVSSDSPRDIQVDPDADGYRQADIKFDDDTDTGDVAKGVAIGAGIGLGVGAAAAAATLFVPGIGFVLGAGAVAAAAAGLAATATTGAIAGGVAKILMDQGVPADRADEMARTYQDGHAILAVTIPEPGLRSNVEDVLHANRAASIESHRAYMA